MGIGISNYFTFRSHRANYQTIGQFLAPDGKLAMGIDALSYDYQNYRVLWKVGCALEFDRFHVGLTLTTPSLEIYGKGSAGINRTISGMDHIEDVQNNNVVIADYQDGLDSDFPTPLALGVGTTITLSTTQLGTLNLYASAEWYAGVDKFEVVKTKEFVGQSDGEIYRNEITHELDDVLNIGLGFEHIFSKNFTAMAASGQTSLRKNQKATLRYPSQILTSITSWPARLSKSKTRSGPLDWDIPGATTKKRKKQTQMIHMRNTNREALWEMRILDTIT